MYVYRHFITRFFDKILTSPAGAHKLAPPGSWVAVCFAFFFIGHFWCLSGGLCGVEECIHTPAGAGGEAVVAAQGMVDARRSRRPKKKILFQGCPPCVALGRRPGGWPFGGVKMKKERSSKRISSGRACSFSNRPWKNEIFGDCALGKDFVRKLPKAKGRSLFGSVTSFRGCSASCCFAAFGFDNACPGPAGFCLGRALGLVLLRPFKGQPPKTRRANSVT